MPVGYLISVVVIAWCTMLAVAPLRRTWSLRHMSWRFGLLVNELPLLAFAWLLASSMLAAGEGDLDSAGGKAVLGIAVLTAIGLAVLVARALRTGPVTDAALREGLGARWRDAIDPATADGLRRHLPWLHILLAPLRVRRGDVERIADVSYGPAGRRNLLDVYRSRAGASGAPVLVYFHGGGFVGGRKNRESRPLVYRLASRGWICVSANYRLGPQAHFPDHHIDAKLVVAWVREHAHELGADPATIFVSGSSAGAHLAAMTALTPGNPAFQPGFEDADTGVAGAVCLYGYYGPLEPGGPDALPSSPGEYAGPGAPPVLVVHGDNDTYVPVEGARELAGRLRMGDGRVVYAELPGGQHTFDLVSSIRYLTVVDAVEAFCAWVRVNRTPREEQPPRAR